MRMSPTTRSALATLAIVATTIVAMPMPAAHAEESGWFWGGETTKANSSGRQTVSFSQKFSPGQIIVSFGDRRLYYINKPGQALSYPIAIPSNEARWQGVTTVSNKRVNPSWTPTPEMIQKNPRLPRWVPGGHPMNPLGVRALYLGSSMYRIHGTDAPWLIGQSVSHGCIRMYNNDVVDLYPRVNTGAKVIVTWSTFKTGAFSSNDEEAPVRKSTSSRRRVPGSAAIATGSTVRSAAVQD
jgi:lipoprotein-anchoring transpeptidase ErfK/SrfK